MKMLELFLPSVIYILLVLKLLVSMFQFLVLTYVHIQLINVYRMDRSHQSLIGKCRSQQYFVTLFFIF